MKAPCKYCNEGIDHRQCEGNTGPPIPHNCKACKMTDLESTEAHFQQLGYTKVEAKESYHHGLKAREYYIDPDDRGFVTMNFGDGFDEQHTSRFGYGAFGFTLAFDKEGKFVGHGAFE